MSYLEWKPSLPEQFSAADKREQHVEELLVFVGPQQLYQERVTDLLNISHYKMLPFKINFLPTEYFSHSSRGPLVLAL